MNSVAALMAAPKTSGPRPPPLPAAEIALFHDLDGSLLELASTPERVIVPSYLPGLLDQLRATLGGALAIVSGRPLATVDRLLAPLRLAGAGLHGAELRRAPGGAVLRDERQHPDGVAEALQHYFADDPRVLVEDKGISVALHYRLAPDRGAECNAVSSALASAMGLSVTQGKMVTEILPASANKGLALQALLRGSPFTARRPVFVGDDITDEDGIAVAQALGGYGIKVGPGASAAQYRLDDVQDVHRWLAASAQLRGSRS